MEEVPSFFQLRGKITETTSILMGLFSSKYNLTREVIRGFIFMWMYLGFSVY